MQNLLIIHYLQYYRECNVINSYIPLIDSQVLQEISNKYNSDVSQVKKKILWLQNSRQNSHDFLRKLFETLLRVLIHGG